MNLIHVDRFCLHTVETTHALSLQYIYTNV